jgi:hypothetical protein
MKKANFGVNMQKGSIVKKPTPTMEETKAMKMQKHFEETMRALQNMKAEFDSLAEIGPCEACKMNPWLAQGGGMANVAACSVIDPATNRVTHDGFIVYKVGRLLELISIVEVSEIEKRSKEHGPKKEKRAEKS